MKRFLILCLVLASCENMQLGAAPPASDSATTTAGHKKKRLPALDVQGHRGARKLMPENTIPAFITALDFGVNTLEMDAAITKDNKVVISHDPFFNHEIILKPDGSQITQNEEKSLMIYKMNYDEVKKYDAGSKGNRWFPDQRHVKAIVPLLTDVIDSADFHARNKGRALPFYNIEVKSHPPFDNVYYPSVEKYTDLIMAVVTQKNILSRVRIASFDLRALKYMHQKYPSVKLVLYANTESKKTFQQRLIELGFIPFIFAPVVDLVDSQLVNDCKAKGIRLIPYVIDDVAEMKRLKALGVNGLITDYPNRAKGLF